VSFWCKKVIPQSLHPACLPPSPIPPTATPHRNATHRNAPHRTAPHRTASCPAAIHRHCTPSIPLPNLHPPAHISPPSHYYCVLFSVFCYFVRAIFYLLSGKGRPRATLPFPTFAPFAPPKQPSLPRLHCRHSFTATAPASFSAASAPATPPPDQRLRPHTHIIRYLYCCVFFSPFMCFVCEFCLSVRLAADDKDSPANQRPAAISPPATCA
jgi:hypothetical protein